MGSEVSFNPLIVLLGWQEGHLAVEKVCQLSTSFSFGKWFSDIVDNTVEKTLSAIFIHYLQTPRAAYEQQNYSRGTF